VDQPAVGEGVAGPDRNQPPDRLLPGTEERVERVSRQQVLDHERRSRVRDGDADGEPHAGAHVSSATPSCGRSQGGGPILGCPTGDRCGARRHRVGPTLLDRPTAERAVGPRPEQVSGLLVREVLRMFDETLHQDACRSELPHTMTNGTGRTALGIARNSPAESSPPQAHAAIATVGPMRIGYGYLTAQHHPDDPRSDVELYREVIDTAVELERAGFDSVWTSEHHFVDDGYLPSQLPVLAAIATRTERIRLGTGVLLAPLFDPLRLAEDAATVDLVSGGRLILGLGSGWRDEEFDGFGISMRERGSRLEGHLRVLRQAWSDGLVTGDERHFRYPGLNVTPKPARPGGPAIWLGGSAEPAVRRVGRLADGYFAGPTPPDRLAERMAWVREEAIAAGRDPGTITANLYTLAFAWRDGDAWDRVREAAWYISWKYRDMGAARGSRERRSPPSPTSEDEERLRKQVIAGTPDEVAERILAYRDLLGDEGTFMVRSHYPGLDAGVAAESRRILADEVLTLIRRA
jgi:probable F420-dependent oxidoreductase